MRKIIIISLVFLVLFFGYRYKTISNWKTFIIDKESHDLSNITRCSVDSDCIFAKDPAGGCVLGINKSFASQFEQTCVGVNGVANSRYDPGCEEVTDGPNCSPKLQSGCPGAEGIRCREGSCKILPCVGEWK